MINLIVGSEGSGKTAKLIELANAELEKTDGLIVYIDRSDNHRRGVDVRIRFLNASEFEIDNLDKFYGLVCGVLNGNYDINRVYIDNIARITRENDPSAVIEALRSIASSNDVALFVTYNTAAIEGVDLEGVNVTYLK